MRSLACKSPGELISARTICAPLEWRIRAVASPIPLAAPVITAPTPVKFVKAMWCYSFKCFEIESDTNVQCDLYDFPRLEKIEQIIAAEVVAPAVEVVLLVAGHT